MLNDVSIMMTAWRRPNYLRKTLRSWGAVRGIREVEIVVALEPSDRQDQIIRTIWEARDEWGLNIRTRVNPERLGVLVNIVETAGHMFQVEDRLRYLVFAEEDLVVSDDVLDYFLWADDVFHGREDVLAVCAHAPEGATADSDPTAVALGERFRCWVWATWRDRFHGVLEPTWDRTYSSGEKPGDGVGWDCNIQERIIPRGGYRTVLPAASRSQNIGKFEGVHQAPGEYAGTVDPSFREVFGVVDYRLTGSADAAG
jgi:hypothetical protein